MLDNPIDRKIRVLILGDSPTVNTGLGRVQRETFKRFDTEKYEMDFVGINYHGSPADAFTDWPHRVWSANPANLQEDPYGRQMCADVLVERAKAGLPYDIFYAHTDIDILHPFVGAIRPEPGQEVLRYAAQLAGIVMYSPLDSELSMRLPQLDITECADYYATYTHWAKLELEKYSAANIHVVPLGVDWDWCNPDISQAENKDFRERVLKIKDPDAFIITSVNRNTDRKDIPRLMMAFAIFLQQRPNSYLYLHCNPEDGWAGLEVLAQKLGIAKRVRCPRAGTYMMLSDDYMNRVYNASHCVATMSRGEGWGFSLTEGFATKTPVVAAYNSAAISLLGDIKEHDGLVQFAERGLAVPSGTFADTGDENPNLWTVSKDTMIRPLADIPSAAKQFEWVYDQYTLKAQKVQSESLRELTTAAHSYARERCNWDSIAKSWDKVFTELVAMRARGEKPPIPIRQGAITQ